MCIIFCIIFTCLKKKRVYNLSVGKVCQNTFKQTSSWSTSSPSRVSSERSAASFLPTPFTHVSSHSSFFHFVTFNSILSGSGLASRSMGGTGLVPFRPLREAGCLTKAGFSCRGECFSCESSPE